MPVRSVIFDIIGKDRASPAFMSAARSAEIAAGRMDRAMARWNRRAESMRATGATLTRHLTVPLLAVGAVAVKSAVDFESSMTKIKTQAGGTARDVRVLGQRVLDLSKYAEQGPQQLADSLYHLKSVGLDNVKAMHALKIASDLAAVGGASLEDTTNALAGAWRTGLTGATNFRQAASTLNAVIGAGNMRMTDLVDALSTGILPSAKTFGLTLKDVGSALAVFTDESVPANVAATRLRMSFSLLGAPSKAAEKQLKRIHLTGLELANDMRKPNGLIKTIGDLKSHLEDPKFHLSLSKQAQLLSHAFGGGRSSSAILSLINNFDVLKRKQDQVTKSMGRYSQAVKTQRDTSQAQFAELVSNLQRAAILLGKQLLPFVLKIVQGLAGWVEKFNSLSPQMQAVARWALLIGAGLGPAIWLLSKLTRGFVLLFGLGVGFVRFGQGLLLTNVGLSTMEKQSYKTGFALRGMLTDSTTKAIGLRSAMLGIAVGATVGYFTRNMSTTTKLVSGLGAAAASAALGFATGGPLGAAIGGVTGLVSALGVSFFHMGHKASAAEVLAQQAMETQNTTAQALLSTLKSINGQYVKTARQSVAENLQSTKLGDTGFNVLSGAVNLGIPIHKLVQGALGGTKAIDQIMRQAFRAGKTPGNEDLAQQFVTQFSAIVGGGGDAEKAFEQYSQAANGALIKTKQLKQGAAGLAKELKGVGVAQLGPGSAFGERAQAVLARNIQYTKRQTLSQKDLRRSIKDSAVAYYGQIAALRNQLLLMGYSADDVDTYISKTAMVPKLKLTQFKVDSKQAKAACADAQKLIDAIRQGNVPNLQVGTDQANAEIRQLHDYINSLHDKTVNIDTVIHTYRTASRGSGTGNATGGFIRGPGTGTSDSIPARLSNGEFVVRAAQARRYRPLLEAINNGSAPRSGNGFATGGPVDTRALTPSSMSRVVSGRVEIDADSQGRLFARFRDLVLDELDYAAQLGRMS